MEGLAPIPMDTTDDVGVSVPKHAGGRPKGRKNDITIIKEQNTVKAAASLQKRRNNAVIVEDLERQKNGPRRRSTDVAGGATLKKPRNELILKPVHDIKPREQGQLLSDNEIATAIKLLTSLHADALAENNESTYGCRIFEKAHDILGISMSALHKLWDQWNVAGVLPNSKASVGRTQKVSDIVTLHAGHIRAFIVKRKLEGKVVEIPDVVKFLKDVCIHYILYIYTIYTSHTHIYIHIY